LAVWLRAIVLLFTLCDTMSTAFSAVSQPLTRQHILARQLLVAAWASLLLGLLVELATVAIAASFGTVTDARPVLAEAVQKVSWSVMVCCGLTLGTSAARSTRDTAMGLLGLFSAPAAFVAARSIHRALSLGLGVPVPPGASPLIIAIIRGVEFATLGVAAAWLTTKLWAGIQMYILAGAAIALAFGSVVIMYTLRAAATAPLPANFVSMAANEFLYPVGCAIVLFTAGGLGTRLAG
jgi:hypothetical protein